MERRGKQMSHLVYAATVTRRATLQEPLTIWLSKPDGSNPTTIFVDSCWFSSTSQRSNTTRRFDVLCRIPSTNNVSTATPIPSSLRSPTGSSPLRAVRCQGCRTADRRRDSVGSEAFRGVYSIRKILRTLICRRSNHLRSSTLQTTLLLPSHKGSKDI